MAFHELVERALHDAAIERARLIDPVPQVEEGGVRRSSVDRPQMALHDSCWSRSEACGQDGRQRGLPRRLLDEASHGGDREMCEHRSQRQSQAEGGVDPADHQHRAHGRPAEIEEVVVTTEPVASEHCAPDLRDLALSAWRAIRRSVYATRSFYTPHRDRLERANEHIATLMAELEGPDADPDSNQQARRDFHAELLAKEVGPSVGWSLLALLGLLLWVGGGLYFALRGVGADDRLRPPAARLAVVLIALGLVVWMLGLYRA